MDIYKRQPDILCLSCYIWNLDYIEEIVLEIGKLRPICQSGLAGRRFPMMQKSIKTAFMCQRSDERRRRENFPKKSAGYTGNEFEKEKCMWISG